MIHLSTSLKYYKQEDIQKAIVEHAKDKEVAARFNEQFGKRPDTLTYISDVMELARQGATSFHCSEELWSNPMMLRTQMQKVELDRLRKGWDLVLDVDCAIVDYSKLAADLIVRELKKHGITSVSAKFSGNKGFHIAVPFEAFPKTVLGRETKELFPEAPKKIALYIKERIKNALASKILATERGNFNAIASKVGKRVEEIAVVSQGDFESERKVDLKIEAFLVIDTLLISSRHMYRMPYSLHEKSGLVSVPVNPEIILEFSKEEAAPEKIKIGNYKFLDRSAAAADEAKRLVVEAFDFATANRAINEKPASAVSESYDDDSDTLGKIPQQFFPACIKKMLEGVEDGRKRVLFVLMNFLRCCNYGNDEHSAIVKDWNNRNKEPLPHLYIEGQLSYSQQKSEKVLPPNCSNASYYKELGIECTAECGRCKNPVAEAKAIYRRAIRGTNAEAPRKGKTKGKRGEE